MNLSSLSKTVLVSALVFMVVVVGVFYFVPTKVERIIERFGATPGQSFDSGYVTFNGVEYFYGKQEMAATSTSLCAFTNPFTATTSVLSWHDSVTRNLTGANQTADLGTTTTIGGVSSSSPPFLLGVGITTTGNGSSAGREHMWLPSTASTTKSGGASGVGALEAFNSVTGASHAILRAGEVLEFRIASSTRMTVTNGTNDIDGTCQAVFQKL